MKTILYFCEIWKSCCSISINHKKLLTTWTKHALENKTSKWNCRNFMLNNALTLGIHNLTTIYSFYYHWKGQKNPKMFLTYFIWQCINARIDHHIECCNHKNTTWVPLDNFNIHQYWKRCLTSRIAPPFPLFLVRVNTRIISIPCFFTYVIATCWWKSCYYLFL